MKKITSILTVIGITVLIFSFNKTGSNKQTVNALIGDISFEKKFGKLPGKNTDENLRIKTHLEYVEDVLRKKDVSNLPEQLKAKRREMLDLLHSYHTAGIFPRNYDYTAERKPCFIDKDNRICAVGYLIEKTEGRESAELINRRHKYDELLAMNDQTVNYWIANSGLTAEECAMIQPSYGFLPTDNNNYISTGYGVSSSVLGGVNMSINTINALQMMRGKSGKAIPAIGLITGTAQVVLGIAAFPKTTTSFMGGNTTNESKKTLSMVNIGLGTTTMMLSAWNLINQKRVKERSTSWNIYTLPAEGSKVNVGLSLTRKI